MYFFIKELQICCAFILDILGFISIIIPIVITFPFFLFFLIVLIGEVEIVFFLGLFSV
jgi:hypothetical protein